MGVARILAVPLLGSVMGLAACGPVPVAQAEQSCLRDARLAQSPRGEVAVGIGSGPGGTRSMSRVSVEIGSDYLRGRDPAQVFERCVVNRSGELPRRPLAEQPGWRG